MTIAKKANLISVGALVVALVFFALFYNSVTHRMSANESSIAKQLDDNDVRMIDFQIVALGDNIANYLTKMEDEIDKTMYNAALLLQEVAARKTIESEELAELAGRTGMDDMYLAGMDGVFYQSTEKSSIGFSIFDIWDGYRMLVRDEAKVLPSAIKIKVETGEIFKFTAIQKLNYWGEVDGILEAALNASTSVTTVMQAQIDHNPELDSINVLESTGLVLTRNAGPGKSAPFQPGDTVTDPDILNVAKNNEPLLKRSGDGKSVIYCKPVERFGAPAYILYLTIDPAGYMENTMFVKSQFADLHETYDNAMLAVAGVSAGLMLILVLVYTFFMRRSLLRPVKTLSRIMGNISEGDGDLTERIDIGTKDEIGALAGNFNLFVEKIEQIVVDAKGAAGIIADSSSEVVANLDNSYEDIRNISASVRHLSENIARQVKSAGDSESISKRLSNDINYLSEQVFAAVGVVARILESKEAGECQIALLVDKNGQSIESSRRTAENIQSLNSQIVSINTIVEEIKNIAKQTQLLSLNASIEAARAGEHGRGFAVVASDVNKLAEESAGSANKIEQIISSIGRSSSESVNAVSGVMNIAHEQASFVEEVSKTFAVITDEIDDIKAVLDNVNKAIDTVSSGKDEVLSNINSLSRTSEDSESNVDTVDSSVESQVRVIQNIKDLSGKTAETIRNLDDTLNRFKVN